jgi:hypothetical protein
MLKMQISILLRFIIRFWMEGFFKRKERKENAKACKEEFPLHYSLRP